jgi:UDP-2,3-diacylglucosamine hydrolase
VRTAIIAGAGGLPAALAAVMDAPFVAAMHGFAPVGLTPDVVFRVERLVPFLDDLSNRGVTKVVFAGAVTRPRLDPALIDAATAQMVPALMHAMAQGDDATLRAVVAIFEDAGLQVVGVGDVAPVLVPGAGVLCGVPSDRDARDADRAAVIVDALGAVDVGQGAVVSGGLCLGVETLAGTDVMLSQVAAMQPKGGVFCKAPKRRQDMRIDLPTIGPDTVDAVARAGLSGIAWAAGGVICLDLPAMVQRAQAQGLFLWAR